METKYHAYNPLGLEIAIIAKIGKEKESISQLFSSLTNKEQKKQGESQKKQRQRIQDHKDNYFLNLALNNQKSIEGSTAEMYKRLYHGINLFIPTKLKNKEYSKRVNELEMLIGPIQLNTYIKHYLNAHPKEFLNPNYYYFGRETFSLMRGLADISIERRIHCAKELDKKIKELF